MLAWASVLGPEFTLPLLQEVAGLEEEKLLDAVEKALAARVLTPRPSLGQEAYAFADNQTREVLYEGISPVRRRRYHLRVGQGVEKVHARRLEEHHDALAHHFLEGNDLPKAAEYAIKAGERAYALYSWERAIAHYQAALELLEELPEDLPRQAQVLERLANLDALLGRRGIRYLQEALELYIRLGDKRKAARLHRLMGSAWLGGTTGQADSEKGLPHLEAAVNLLEGEPDSAEKASSHNGFAMGLRVMLELERALEQGREALKIAERLDEPDEVGLACAELAVILAQCGEVTEAERYAERGWRAALQGKDAWVIARVDLYPVVWWPWRNDREWLSQSLERWQESRRRTHLERHDRLMHGLAALHSALSGKPEEAAEALRRTAEAASRRPYLHRPWTYFPGSAHAVLGDWEQAERLLAEALGASESDLLHSETVEASDYYGRFLLDSGDTAKAEVVLDKGFALAHEKGAITQELNLLPLLCELHVKTGRLEQAEQDLKRAREILARPQPWRGLTAPVYLAEGMLATARGTWTAAETGFGKALEAERAYGFLYNEARVLFEWGELYLKRGDQGAASSAPTSGDAAGARLASPLHAQGQDRERGMQLLDQALAIYQQCAAKKDVEKVLARKGLLQA
jgi:tetratricopeptide (TPR) repeat protein